MSIRTKLAGDITKDEPTRLASVSVSFQLTRKDVFEMIGQDIIFETDPDLDEENWIDDAEQIIKERWSSKSKVEESLRLKLFSQGISHRLDEEALNLEEIYEHRPVCAKLIDSCINAFLPQLNVSDDDRKAFKNWKKQILGGMLERK